MTAILVVDDDPLQRHILNIILSDEGYETHVASSGEEALRVAKTSEPDVVLTDICMGDMDGIELMRELKRLRNAPEVIIMSASGAVLKEEAMGKGAFSYLEKPLGKYRILLNVKRALASPAKFNKRDPQALLDSNPRNGQG